MPEYKTDANAPINPVKHHLGLTKREYFAAMAMQGLLASDMNGATDVANCAAVFANELIKTLNAEAD